MTDEIEKKHQEEIEKLLAQIKERDGEIGILKSEQAKDREITLLSRAKASLQLETAALKDANKALAAQLKQELGIRKSLLTIIGMARHDVGSLHTMASDDSNTTENFVDEAMRVIQKMHDAFQLSDVLVPKPEAPADEPSTGVRSISNGNGSIAAAGKASGT